MLRYSAKFFPAVLAALLICTGCRRGPSPTDAYNQIGAHTKTGDWGYLYDHTDSTGQKKLGLIAAMAVSYIVISGKAPPKTDGLEGRDFFAAVMNYDPSSGEEAIGEEVVSESIDGNKATLRVKRGGEEEDVSMVWDNNEWKFTF